MYEWLHICSDMIDNEQEVKKTTITFLWARNEAFNQKIDIIISMQLNHRTLNIVTLLIHLQQLVQSFTTCLKTF